MIQVHYSSYFVNVKRLRKNVRKTTRENDSDESERSNRKKKMRTQRAITKEGKIRNIKKKKTHKEHHIITTEFARKDIYLIF